MLDSSKYAFYLGMSLIEGFAFFRIAMNVALRVKCSE